MDRDAIGNPARGVIFYALAYGALFVAIALAAVIGATWHTGLLNLYVQMRWDKWAYAAYGNAVTVILVLAWLILALVLEHRFSHASNLRVLRSRVAPVLLVQLILAAVSAAIVAVFLPGRAII